jgi:mannose-6-phosphate isomerase-like protein (cupin superfamily)
MNDVLLKRFEIPDETRHLERGRFDIVKLGGMTIGRATYQPGWKWSEHVGPKAGTSRCTVKHVGMVVSGKAAVEFEDGEILLLQPGELFAIPGAPHDSWVVGEERYVSLHFLGADEYAKKAEDA